MPAPLEDLEQSTDFIRRHIGPSDGDIQAMLKALGIASLDALIDKAVPASIRTRNAAKLPSRSESQVLAEIRRIASRNKVLKSMIGMGYYDCHTPSVILRNVLENPGWYTAYTPYQAEISQGRLEALLSFQQMVIDLTGLPVANASLLDEATAAAEAMTMMKRLAKSESDVLFVDSGCHPQTIAVVATRAEPLGLKVEIGDALGDLDPARVFGIILQYPTTTGDARDYAQLVQKAHAAGAHVTVATDLLSLVLLTPPGEWGADVVIGSAQRFGVPLGFGGPHAAFMATTDDFKRHMPGRLIGVSVDRHGKPAMRLALQTREQHIRREKATSNICTAQVLLANMAAFYAVYHGPQGLKTIAARVHRLAVLLALGLRKLGFTVESTAFFDTIAVNTGKTAGAIVKRAARAGINVRPLDGGRIGVSCDEATTREDVKALWLAFSGKKSVRVSIDALDRAAGGFIPARLQRRSAFLTHPVFNSYHSETEMMRYLKRLEDRDVALNRAMIPLGSCTMKLNAATEMIPVTWPEFARMHPFAPLDQAQGYLELIHGLEAMLKKLTGFAAVSVQPNAGSQGEYAGLLAIRKYHRSRGEGHRNVCLIPSSAHGTNPASASMANMTVVVVGCDTQGNVDLNDLRAKAKQNARNLAALMVTYPSTHGVFEEGIRDICRIVHEHGGQVYMDGANLNALVGICRPGEFGPDVAHMNLHKTFCIPHGGGGPGVGPIGVAKHLAPFLPNHPLVPEAGPKKGVGPVSATPWGSAAILPISWTYIAMMGWEGLKKATQVAILNANYVAARLKDHYPVLYTGPNGLIAHECILDVRPIKDAAGVTVEDFAKRLIDYGFHAPTMSFPVPGTLMVEPTESESKAELDRFCEAMIAMHGEVKRVERGDWPKDDNPLHNSPHTAEEAVAQDWKHAYTREEAVFPVPGLRQAKYWPPVGRIDNVYGDRNFICTCPPMEAYKTAAE